MNRRKVACIMALKSAYNYVRENIDSNFDKYVADNVSYGCEENIEDIKRWIPNSSLCLLGELLECIISDIIILIPYRILVE